MKKTTLFFNADCSELSIGAQDRDAKNWAHFLNEDKFRIIIFAKGVPDKRLLKNNIKIIYLLSKRPFVNYIKQLLFLIFYPSCYLMLSKVDSIESTFLFITGIIPLRKKIVYSIVNLFPYEDKKISKVIVNKSFKIFAISKLIQKQIFDFSGKDSSLVHLSYDLNKFYPAITKNDRIRVICVGSLQIRKQPFIFADLAKMIPDADFIWIGDGYYYDLLQRKILDQSIENLLFPGAMSNEEVGLELRKSDIFLFPSMHEGFPNSIVEAMASGLAIITYHSYCPEAVLDGVNGYICENIFDMIDKIKYLISDSTVLESFKKKSYLRARTYSGDRNIIEFERAILNK